MDDLISRAAAKFQACNWSVKPNAVIYDGIKEAIKSQLDMAPAVDAAPVVHGEWKWSHGGQCSECGFHNSNFDYNFCPNCGAKMDADNPTV